MYDAQYLITRDVANGITLYSPWFPSGGAHAKFVVDLVQAEDATLTVKAWTKNRDDPGDTGTEIATTTALTTPAQQYNFGTTSVAALELVRFTFKCLPDGEDVGMVLFRMLTIVWFDGVRAP